MDTLASCRHQHDVSKQKLKVMKPIPNLIVLLLLLLLCRCMNGSTCPSSVPSLTSATTQLNSFTELTPASIYSVKEGPISKALYYSFSVSSSTAFVKITSNSCQIWSKSISFRIAMKSLEIDKSEKNLYFIILSLGMLTVGRLKTSDGTLIDAQGLSPFCAIDHDVQVHALSDNSGYYVIQHYNTDYIPHVLKYSFSTNVYKHYKFDDMHYYSVGSLMISDSELFCILKILSSPQNAVFIKFTYQSTSADWAKKMGCSSSVCNIINSESVMSSDKLKIFSFLTYSDSLWNVYFTTFKTSDGLILGTTYKTTVSCSSVYGSVVNGDNVIAILYCTQYCLTIYNIPSDLFTFKSFSSGSLNGLGVESGSGRIIAVGGKSSMGYIAKFPLSSLSEMTDFSNTTSTAMSAYTNTIISISATISAQTDGSITDCISSVLIQEASYVPGALTPPDIYYQTSSETYSLLENTSATKVWDLTCSRSGSTSISHSIASSSSQAPSWVSVDAASGQLSISAPNVTADMTFSFYISSTITGISNPVKKLISINVLNCIVEFCTTCSTTTICSVCNTGYNLTTSNTCLNAKDDPSQTTTAMTVTVKTMIAFTAGLICALSMANLSSMNSLWSIFNQMQIFFLLLLTRAYIPDDIKKIITGLKFILNPSYLIPFENIPFYHTFIEKFYFSFNNENLEAFGLKSTSSFYNTSGLFISFIIMIIFHILFKILLKLISLCNSFNSKWCCPVRVIRWVVEKLLIIMSYGCYIRFILQITQFMLVASTYEIYIHQTSYVWNILSFVLAIFLLLACFFITGIVIYLSLSPYKTLPNLHNKIGEIFNGIKMEKKYKIYASLIIIRKMIFVFLLIFLMFISSKLLIGILTCIEICYIIYLFMMKPYKEAKGNIIEVLNEIFFLLLLSNLVFLNEKSDWTSSKISIYSYIIVSNSFVTLLIIFIDAIRLLAIKIYLWTANLTARENQVSPSIKTTTTLDVIRSRAKKREELKEENKSISDNDMSEARFEKKAIKF